MGRGALPGGGEHTQCLESSNPAQLLSEGNKVPVITQENAQLMLQEKSK